MKNLLAIFSTIISFIILSTYSTCSANDRWAYLGKPIVYGTGYSLDATFIDTRTLTYDQTTGVAILWFKDTYKNQEKSVGNIKVNLNTKTYKWLKRRISPNDIFQDAENSWHIYEPGKYPEDDLELVFDYVCAQYNLPPLHPPKNERWHWLLSTNDMTFTYATDSVRFNESRPGLIDSTKHTVRFVGHLTYTDGREYTNEFTIDFKNNKYYRLWKGVEIKDIFPDTFEEQVADAVAQQIGKP